MQIDVTAVRATSASPRSTVSKARQGLAVYFAVLLPLSCALEGVMIAQALREPKTNLGELLFYLNAGLMCLPALASLIARLALHEGFRDVSFRVGGRRTWHQIGIAMAFATAVGLMAHSLAWTTGFASFVRPGIGLGAALQGITPVAGLALDLLLANTFATLVGLLFASGEEIGWRGYMLTRLVDAGLPRPVLLSGAIWGFWRLPVMLEGTPPSPTAALPVASFMVQTTALSLVAARGRFNTGSVWPAIVLHANWNAVVSGCFDRFAGGPNAAVWVGASGLLVALAALGLALPLTRGTWVMDRCPPASCEDNSPVIVARP